MGIKISNDLSMLSVSNDAGHAKVEVEGEKKAGLLRWIGSWFLRGDQNKELKALVVEDFKSRAQAITGHDALKAQFLTALEKALNPKGRAPLDESAYEAAEVGLSALANPQDLKGFACLGGEFLTIKKSVTHLPPGDSAAFSFYDAHDFRKKLEAGNIPS